MRCTGATISNDKIDQWCRTCHAKNPIGTSLSTSPSYRFVVPTSSPWQDRNIFQDIPGFVFDDSLAIMWFGGFSTGNKSWFLLFSLTKNMSSNELFCWISISTTFIVFIYQPVGRPSPRNVSLNLWKPSISYPLINSEATRNYHLRNQRSKWPCSTAMLVYQRARKSNLRLTIFQAWCHIGLVYMLIPC